MAWSTRRKVIVIVTVAAATWAAVVYIATGVLTFVGA